jgi:hypothetical protein
VDTVYQNICAAIASANYAEKLQLITLIYPNRNYMSLDMKQFDRSHELCTGKGVWSL